MAHSSSNTYTSYRTWLYNIAHDKNWTMIMITIFFELVKTIVAKHMKIHLNSRQLPFLFLTIL